LRPLIHEAADSPRTLSNREYASRGNRGQIPFDLHRYYAKRL
jgi:hypothetical protein